MNFQRASPMHCKKFRDEATTESKESPLPAEETKAEVMADSGLAPQVEEIKEEAATEFKEALPLASSAMRVTTPAGKSVLLEPAPSAEEQVAALRQRVAKALGVHYKQIRLLLENQMLADGPYLGDSLHDLQQDRPVIITAVLSQLDIEEMKVHIKFNHREHPLAFFTMDWIEPRLCAFSPKKKRRRQEAIRGLIFPKATDININMMPFVIGQKESVPEEYQQYWPMIEACHIPSQEHGKIGYLTIHESHVSKDSCQRRPGLHIETPGVVMTEDGKYHSHPFMWGCGLLRGPEEHPSLPRVEGGLYMANSVENTCKVWDALIEDPGLVAGHLGDLEHIREILGEGNMMHPNTIYWLTDKTPHETLPVKKDTYRQFFRVVTSSLSAWFPAHSTANRLGVKPDLTITKIIEGDKFEGALHAKGQSSQNTTH